jgi:hypothetical protein
MDTQCEETTPDNGCATIPELERLCYFLGQLLSPADFQAEQAYFDNKLALLTRYGLGHGVACGLDISVAVVEPEACEGATDERRRAVVYVEPGVAVDCRGRLVIVRRRLTARVWDLLDAAGRQDFEAGKPFYVSIEFTERSVGPSRAVFRDACESAAPTSYARVRDGSRLVINTTPVDTCRCEACCDECGDCGVLLAAVSQVCEPGQPVEFSLDVAVRRMLGVDQTTSVRDISWVHGGAYSRDDTERLLRNGLWIRFSCPVRSDTIQPGVVELVTYEGGRGRRDEWYYKQVVLEPQSTPLTTELRVLVKEPETFQEGDQLLLKLRSDFVLDECCRPVDGNHIGGAVPRFEPEPPAGTTFEPVSHPAPAPLPCTHPPTHSGRWTSGNGVAGGTFESWLFVASNHSGGDPYGTAQQTTGRAST